MIPKNWKPVAACRNTSVFVNPDEIEQGIRSLAYQAGFDADTHVAHQIEYDGKVFQVYISPELAEKLEAM